MGKYNQAQETINNYYNYLIKDYFNKLDMTIPTANGFPLPKEYILEILCYIYIPKYYSENFLVPENEVKNDVLENYKNQINEHFINHVNQCRILSLTKIDTLLIKEQKILIPLLEAFFQQLDIKGTHQIASHFISLKFNSINDQIINMLKEKGVNEGNKVITKAVNKFLLYVMSTHQENTLSLFEKQKLNELLLETKLTTINAEELYENILELLDSEMHKINLLVDTLPPSKSKIIDKVIFYNICVFLYDNLDTLDDIKENLEQFISIFNHNNHFIREEIAKNLNQDKYENVKKFVNNYFDDQLKTFVKNLSFSKKIIKKAKLSTAEIKELIYWIADEDFHQRMGYNEPDRDLANIALTALNKKIPHKKLKEIKKQRADLFEKIDNIQNSEKFVVGDLISEFFEQQNIPYQGSTEDLDEDMVIALLKSFGLRISEMEIINLVQVYFNDFVHPIRQSFIESLRELISPYAPAMGEGRNNYQEDDSSEENDDESLKTDHSSSFTQEDEVPVDLVENNSFSFVEEDSEESLKTDHSSSFSEEENEDNNYIGLALLLGSLLIKESDICINHHH